MSRYDLAAASLNSEFSWVREQLAIFKGNLVAATFKIDGIPEIKVVSVHVPTWPLDATDLTPKDLQKIKLEHNSRVWATELLWSAMVAERDYDGWLVVGGDLNTSVTFDKMWSGGPHGNQEVLDRLHALELTECLVTAQGCLTATFQNASDKKVIHQIDHLFVSHPLAARLVECGVSDRDLIFGESLSDHLPIIADFKIGT
ncbi:MAG: hypothetical protein J5I65_03205 [Aridibacter famidurans]|nr:hypothetical protein [Aridibacter famidurans]